MAFVRAGPPSATMSAMRMGSRNCPSSAEAYGNGRASGPISASMARRSSSRLSASPRIIRSGTGLPLDLDEHGAVGRHGPAGCRLEPFWELALFGGLRYRQPAFTQSFGVESARRVRALGQWLDLSQADVKQLLGTQGFDHDLVPGGAAEVMTGRGEGRGPQGPARVDEHACGAGILTTQQ